MHGRATVGQWSREGLCATRDHEHAAGGKTSWGELALVVTGGLACGGSGSYWGFSTRRDWWLLGNCTGVSTGGYRDTARGGGQHWLFGGYLPGAALVAGATARGLGGGTGGGGGRCRSRCGAARGAVLGGAGRGRTGRPFRPPRAAVGARPRTVPRRREPGRGRGRGRGRRPGRGRSPGLPCAGPPPWPASPPSSTPSWCSSAATSASCEPVSAAGTPGRGRDAARRLALCRGARSPVPLLGRPRRGRARPGVEPAFPGRGTGPGAGRGVPVPRRAPAPLRDPPAGLPPPPARLQPRPCGAWPGPPQPPEPCWGCGRPRGAAASRPAVPSAVSPPFPAGRVRSCGRAALRGGPPGSSGAPGVAPCGFGSWSLPVLGRAVGKRGLSWCPRGEGSPCPVLAPQRSPAGVGPPGQG